ncbi:Fatty aldehyde dehydrogenase [Zancudomyces culisetae]|uniref:Aldehyde dehydrogenase n=1 Tax=Zancudomyces culisetae TaxID=1213189 RepID=A0A1R1PPC8_ZANCU|nr:Fatty aldehyde dehydrogenase [Zancudomyces culisetae]|eukprot:OMH82814.1 Fatty aldehyde dehydrogenase [Zancudomyces culisetae]
MVSENRDQLAEALYKDLRRPAYEAHITEILPAEYEGGYMLQQMDTWLKPVSADTYHQPQHMLGDVKIHKAPLGVALMISAWNYPIRLPLMPLVGAIAAGNVVVLKPSEISVHSSRLLTELIEKYLDSRVVRVVNGGVEETTVLLKQKVDHMMYTGNGTVGRIIAKAAAEQLCKVSLELGGKSPALISGSVNQDHLSRVASRIVWGKYLNCGQTCIAVDYVMVENKAYERFLLSILEAVFAFYGKDSKKSPDYARIISERQFDRLKKLVENTKGNILTGKTDEWDRSTLFIPPVVVDDVGFDDSLMSEELFGPILPIIKVDSVDEGIKYIQKHDHPLSLYFFGDEKDASKVIANTRSGSCVINDVLMQGSVHGAPFGGVGPSGVGGYSGKASIDEFTHSRTVIKAKTDFPSESLESVRNPPYTGPGTEWKLPAIVGFIYPTFPAACDSVGGRVGWFEFSIILSDIKVCTSHSK